MINFIKFMKLMKSSSFRELIHCTSFEDSLILLHLLQYDLPLAGSFASC